MDTAGTLCNGAKAIIEVGGATEVYACATHGVLSGPAIERIEQSVIKELVLLDTIALPEEKKIPKITMVPVGPVFAEAIERIYGGQTGFPAVRLIGREPDPFQTKRPLLGFSNSVRRGSDLSRLACLSLKAGRIFCRFGPAFG